MMRIHIEALSFDTIIGLLPFEREEPQRVIIDIEADYRYAQGIFIDYAEMASMVTEQIQQKKFELLEDALLHLADQLHQHYPQITRLYIKIGKPDILETCQVALSRVWEFTS